MTLTSTIDPGKRGAGLALFDGTELVHAQYVSGRGGQAHPLLEVCDGVRCVLAPLGVTLELVIIEKPKVYDAKHQKGDQGDLIDLAVSVGMIAREVVPYARSILLIEPAEWKGQLPKDVSNARTTGKLTAAELARIDRPSESLLHNVLDAIGIGLWRFDR